MAYVAPSTKTTGAVITAAVWNQDIVENVLALKDPETQSYILNEGSDYTTTSTSFVDVDAGTGANTKLRLDLTTVGGDVLVNFHGSFQGSAAMRVYLDLLVDGARLGGDDGILASGIHLYTTEKSGLKAINFTRLLTGLSASTHTIKLQWKVDALTATLHAGAGTSNYDVHPQFWAREVS